MKLIAFIKKDIIITLSYRFNLFLNVISSLMFLLFIYYISKTFSGSISTHLQEFHGDYFSFALVGISVSSFVSVGLHTLAAEIRNSQVEGTLEALLCTPTSIYTILIGNSLWSFIKAFINSCLLLLVGYLFFNFYISLQNIFIILFILLLVLFSFILIGMLSASFIMIFKQGNPINFIFGYSSFFFGGIIFPVQVLPDSMQVISQILPITHAIQALRKLLLSDYQIGEIQIFIVRLIIFIIILSPLSFFSFNFSIKRAKIHGSLVQY